MKKALIIYGSTTGNTEYMTDLIGATLKESGVEIEVKEVVNANVNDLSTEYDVLILGCAAYGDAEIELQDDFNEYYEQIEDSEVKLEGKKVAVFAPGDSSYEHFCGSVDMLENKMEELGGQLIVEGLKVDGDPSDSADDIKEWATRVAAA